MIYQWGIGASLLCTNKTLMQQRPRAIKRLQASSFNAVVDCSIQSLEECFQSQGEVRNQFGVLLDFSQLDAHTPRDQCKLLVGKLTCGEQANIDKSAPATKTGRLPELSKSLMVILKLLICFSQNRSCKLCLIVRVAFWRAALCLWLFPPRRRAILGTN